MLGAFAVRLAGKRVLCALAARVVPQPCCARSAQSGSTQFAKRLQCTASGAAVLQKRKCAAKWQQGHAF
jgi:hypothetical protein